MQPRTLLSFGALLLSFRTPILSAETATFRIGDVTATSGQAEISVPLTISVDNAVEGAEPIAAIRVTLRYDPSVLGAVTLETARPTVSFGFRDQSLFVQPGMVGFAAQYG